MKRYLPIIIVVLVILLIVGGFWFWRSRRASQEESGLEPEGVLIETTLEERPYITLTPSSDGHWLTIDVTRIQDAESLEYELLYETEGGATQGSISSVKLKGETTYSKRILLGSESSGKFKYDEGVTQGTVTVRLRGGPGTRKFITDFHLQRGDDELTSIDGKFTISGTLSSTAFYVTMHTVGLPEEFEGEVITGPYGAFSSGAETVKSGEMSLEVTEEEAILYSWAG
ncbi:MAG: hypothetical protein GTN76_13505, partial [Candidatus Aenigmarchaeota archaeon]|nr:hypothetical protein [Candidatus Aenigmarchaeota archaeon]